MSIIRMNKKVLITGVAGFIGSHIANRFLKEGFVVIGVDDLSGGNEANIPVGVEFYHGDLSNRDTILKIPKDCTFILHLAGQSSGEISFDNPISDLHKNTISTLNLIEYGIQNKSEKILYASSMSVYGDVMDKPIVEDQKCNPLSCYGVGKLAAEGYLKVYQKQLPYVSLRMFNVYGPGQDMENLRQGMASIFVSQALKNGDILVKGSAERFRDFIHIDDVVEAWYRATVYQSTACQILNLGTGSRTTVGQLLEKICSQVLGSSFHIDGCTLGDQTGIYADCKKLNKVLGMKNFVLIDDGLRDFISWAKQGS